MQLAAEAEAAEPTIARNPEQCPSRTALKHEHGFALVISATTHRPRCLAGPLPDEANQPKERNRHACAAAAFVRRQARGNAHLYQAVLCRGCRAPMKLWVVRHLRGLHKHGRVCKPKRIRVLIHDAVTIIRALLVSAMRRRRRVHARAAHSLQRRHADQCRLVAPGAVDGSILRGLGMLATRLGPRNDVIGRG